jgi:hypothetical protein
MALVFKSSTPETLVFTRTDRDGNQSTVTATQVNGNRHDMVLVHPGGETFRRAHYGPGLMDGMSQFFVEHEGHYRDAKARGFRPRQPVYDHNRPINEAVSPIIPVGERR